MADMPKMGRPKGATKHPPEVREAFEKMYKEGVTIVDACRKLGISVANGHNWVSWIKRGVRRGDEPLKPWEWGDPKLNPHSKPRKMTHLHDGGVYRDEFLRDLAERVKERDERNAKRPKHFDINLDMLGDPPPGRSALCQRQADNENHDPLNIRRYFDPRYRSNLS
jgi:transposase-like protein